MSAKFTNENSSTKPAEHFQLTEEIGLDQSHEAATSHSDYQSPELFVIGEALDLIRSGSSAKYPDGYSGYYWER